MTPHIGDAPDNQQRGIPMISMAELRNIFQHASEDDLRAIGEALSKYTYDALNARIQGDVRDDRKIRITSAGSDVTNTAAGTSLKFAGESYFDHLNFIGGAVNVASVLRGRQADIRMDGGGPYCLDYLVVKCWEDEVAANHGVEGQTFSSMGCTYKVYSTVQGAATNAASTLPNAATIGICPGLYDEVVTFSSQVQAIGFGDFNSSIADTYFTGSPANVQIPYIRGVAGSDTITFGSVAASQSSIQNVAVKAQSGKIGIETLGAHSVTIDHCYVTGADGTGIACGANTAKITDCLFDACATGIDTSDNSNHLLVAHNMFANCTIGVTVGGNDNHVTDNTFNATTTCLKYASAPARTVIENNTFTDAGTFLDGGTANIQPRNAVRNNHGDFTVNFLSLATISSASTGPLLLEHNSASGGSAGVPIVYPTGSPADMVIIDRNNVFDATGGALSAYKTNGGSINHIANHNLAELAAAGGWSTLAPIDVEHVTGFKGWPFYIVDDGPVTLAWVSFGIDWGGTTTTYAANAGTILTGGATNYVYADSSAVTINTTGFPATQHKKLASIVTSAGNNSITSHVRYGDIWYVATPAGIGAAPNSEPFVTIGNSANLSAERALTAGNGVGFDDGGANGAATLKLVPLTALYDQSGAFNWVNRGGDLLIANSKDLKIYSDNSATPSTLVGEWDGATGKMALGGGVVTDAFWIIEPTFAPTGVTETAMGYIAGTLDISGAGLGNPHRGLYVVPNITRTNGPATVTGQVRALQAGLALYDNSSGVTYADVAAWDMTIALFETASITTLRGVQIRNPGLGGSGTIGTYYGIDIPVLSAATLNVGIRNLATMRQVGALTIGADAAITAGLIADITGNVGVKNEGELRLYDSGSSNYIGIRSNNARTADLVYVLPATDPTAGQVLSASAPVAGVVTLSWAADAGAVATDAIWDAKGDLAVGTGANTAAKLTVGANNKVLIAASGETTGLKWDYVYHEVTVTVENPTATENIVVRQFTQAVTIDAIQAVVIGGTSVTIDPEHGSTITTATKLLSAAEVVASASTTGEHIGGTGTAMAASFNDATLAAGDFLRLETTAISGTPTQLSVTFKYHIT